MRRARVFTLSTLGMLTVLVLGPAGQASAHAKIECHNGVANGIVARTDADPIVLHDLPDSTHNHAFWGSVSLQGLTVAQINGLEYSDVVGTGTSCENVDDSALYWAPTVYRDGSPASVHRLLAYYRGTNNRDKDISTKPYPADARMLSRVTNWTCGASSSRPGPFTTPQQADCGAATGPVNLTAHVDFPNCYSGTLNSHAITGMTADYSDLNSVTNRFTFAGGKKFARDAACPSTHPNRVPSLRLAIAWGDNTAAYWRGRTVTSSHGGADFQNYHADFWNAWRQSAGTHGGLAGMVTTCINTAASSHHSGANVSICGS
jgi:hypothetical protein